MRAQGSPPTHLHPRRSRYDLPVAFIDQISTVGFSDLITVAQLRRTRFAKVPRHSGIYLIERGARRRVVSQFEISALGGSRPLAIGQTDNGARGCNVSLGCSEEAGMEIL